MTDKWHWLRHNYSTWKPYVRVFNGHLKNGTTVRGMTELRQQRQCVVCGDIEDEFISDADRVLNYHQQSVSDRVQAAIDNVLD